MIGHTAVRRFVMGEDASAREADDDELERMRSVIREALAAGAFGFTTSLSPTHYDWDGSPVPSRFASHKEVLELGSTLSEFGTGGIEVITETSVMGKEGFVEADRRLLKELSLRSGRPVNFNELSQNSARPGVWRDQIAFMKEASAAGAQVYAVARYQRLDNLFNLKSVDSFTQWPRWVEVLMQPDERRLELLRDPEVRAAMRDEADRHDTQDPPAARRLGIVSFLKSKTGRYREYEGLPLREIAEKTGKHPVDIIVDWSLDEGEQAEFTFIGVLNGDLDAVAEIIHSPYALAGISDAGAHTDRVSGSYYSTFMLSHWVRDKGVISLEDVIRRLTFIPASLYSLWDRGQIREGLPADIVVFDLDALEWLPTERFNDFPGGESRLGNRAKGYDYLVVDGQVVMDHGADSGARPGRVLRSGDYRYDGR